MKLKKALCLLLVISIVALTGCGAKDAEAVAQEEMEAQELQQTIERIEYMGLLAAIDSDTLASAYKEPAYIGDADGDGYLEMLYGDMRFVTFDKEDNNALHYTWTQGGGFVVDSNGLCYCSDTMAGPDYDNYDTEIGWSGYTFYDLWNGTEYVEAYTRNFVDYYDENRTDEESWYSADNADIALTTEQVDTLGFYNGNEPREYSSYSFNACYRDHVVQSLQDSLASTYSYYSYSQKDVDGDGSEETIISIPEIFVPWIRNLRDVYDAEPDLSTLESVKYSVADIERGHTAVLVISTKGETTTVTACAIPENVYDSAEYIDVNAHHISMGGYTAYLPVSAVDFAALSGEDRQGVLSAFATIFESYGYYDTVFKIADVAEHPGDEILCFSKDNYGLFVNIISLSDGVINLVNQEYINYLSYYLVEHNGKTHILTYEQYYSGGYNPTYSYSYHLYRYGLDNVPSYADSKEVEYSSSQSDATSVSSFFTALNVYLEGDLTILHDTYALTGQEWMDQSDIDYGDRPTTNDQLTETGTLGFVKVYAHTWLNLREGPGTEYDRVLLDPNDPQSYVKQALGSPVTILEEIETGDPENPVWVRIRIVYQDRILEGYSSKRYIKVVGE